MDSHGSLLPAILEFSTQDDRRCLHNGEGLEITHKERCKKKSALRQWLRPSQSLFFRLLFLMLPFSELDGFEVFH